MESDNSSINESRLHATIIKHHKAPYLYQVDFSFYAKIKLLNLIDYLFLWLMFYAQRLLPFLSVTAQLIAGSQSILIVILALLPSLIFEIPKTTFSKEQIVRDRPIPSFRSKPKVEILIHHHNWSAKVHLTQPVRRRRNSVSS